ncbi:uncharacterized protein LOC113340597 [Papaver somniferum]|uniref:uncharacterized protein LOC113340597 n=1 Tax=Papaver somniferum TaxID=3469 RepID=UPI000E701934|nr:uncharacterized protein LOC113340597 [Papaver somniferum]
MGPEEDEVMINIDGSFKETTAGFRAVLRDHKGKVTDCATGGSEPISVATHELQGVELGLNLAIANHLPKVHLCVDSMTVFLLFNSPEPKPPWSLIHLWRRVSALLGKFQRVRVSYFYRETNRAADWLASQNPGWNVVRLTPGQFSSEFSLIHLEDSSGKLYWREFCFFFSFFVRLFASVLFFVLVFGLS